MKEAEYAGDKYAMVHRVISALIIAGAIYFGFKNGHYSIGRTIMGFVIPFGCIWFPEAVAAVKDDLFSPGFIRWCGWVLLLIVAFLPPLLGMIFW